MESALFVRVLGELEVERGGRAIALPASRKTRALLGYLVVTGRPVLRERLCDLLWDGPDDPRAALRWSLTKLRPIVDDTKHARLAADRIHVAFEAHGAASDLDGVRAARSMDLRGATSAALREVVAAMRGDLLEGLDLPDCPRFEAWLRGAREAIRQTRVAALDALVDALAAALPEEALGHARARLAIDPLVEGAHAAVIRVLGELGRRADAIEQFETCRRILATTVGRKPSADLVAARASLGAVSIPPAPPPPPRSTSLPRTVEGKLEPIFGRLEERALIDAHLSAASAGHAGKLVVFRGEAGMGKSRLLEHAAARVREAGGAALFGRAYEAEAVRAYGPWIAALKGLGDDGLAARAPALAALLPSPVARATPPSDREQLFEAMIDLVRTRAADAPLAVLIDDLQWIDDASAALLHAAVRAIAPGRVFFAAAARGGELDDNPAALRLLRGLRRSGNLTAFDLAPLAAGDAAALALSIDRDADAARIAAESGGNPLYAVHLAREPGTGGAMPRTLREVLDERLERLPNGARELASWAAAVGRSFDPDLLGRASGTPPADLVSGIADLERLGILRSAGPSGSLDFAHDLLRRAALARVSEPRQRLMHLYLARTLAGADDEGGALAADVAHHAALGGDAALSGKHAVVAADRCLRLFARKDADAIATRALAEVSRLEGPARISLEIALLRVRVEAGIGEAPRLVARIRALLEASTREAELAGLSADAAAGQYALGMLHYYADDHRGAHVAALAAAEHARAAEPRVVARTIANAASCLAELERDGARARELALEARGIAERHGVDLPDAWLALGLRALLEGDSAGARPLLSRSLELAVRLEDRWHEFWTLRRLTMIDLDEDRFDDALTRTVEMRRLADRFGEGSERATADALDALARYGLGAADGAELVAQAAEGLRLADAKGAAGYLQVRAAEIDLDGGRAGSARTRTALAIEAARALQRKNLLATAFAAQARAAFAEGDGPAANEDLAAATAALDGPGDTSARARAAVAAARAALTLSTLVSTEATTPRGQSLVKERR